MALGPTTSGTGGNNLEKPGDPGTLDPYTLMLWQYFNSVASGTGIFYRGGSAEAYIYPGGTPTVYWDGPSIYSTTVLSTNTWYHLTFARTDTTTEMFVNGVSEGTGGAPGTATEFGWGYRRNSNTRRAAVKFWGALLSDEEILQEMEFHVPIRTVGLERWLPFISTDTTFRDYSGTGVSNFNVYGTPTQGEPGPPITWRKGASKIFVPLGVAADISHVAALADSFDNVVQRRPIKVTNF